MLISTTVIEVGVDVPNATVMLVENAERFGLAQLHQLRGRIGRGATARSASCSTRRSRTTSRRERGWTRWCGPTDGFELADEDLRLRGEGTLFDIRQSGMPDLKLARLAEDVELVQRARARAFALLEERPRSRAATRRCWRELRRRFGRLDRVAVPVLSASEPR